MNTRRLEKYLTKRGLLPQGCTNVEILIGVNTALKVRYERMLSAAESAQWGLSLSEAAAELAIDDERNRAALAKEPMKEPQPLSGPITIENGGLLTKD